MTPGDCLFRRLIGTPFDSLPAPIRALHRDAPELAFTGRCDVQRGTTLLASLMAVLASLPAAGRDVPLRVSIQRANGGETWTREFAGKPMRSFLRERAGLLEEKLGPTTFRFALRAVNGEIVWGLVGVRVLGFPLPLKWFAGVSARESADDGTYRFDVRAQLPVAGLLVHYRGALDVDA